MWIFERIYWWKKYFSNNFIGNYEIVSLTGTINTMNDEFYTHIHMSAGNDKGEVFGSIEAVKTVSDVLLPVGGEILEVNAAVGDNGEASLVNNDPYGEGWLVKIKMTNPAELDELLDAAGYHALIGA